MSLRVTEAEVQRVLRDLGGSGRGLLHQIQEVARANLAPAGVAEIDAAVAAVIDRISICLDESRGLFQAFAVDA